MITQKNVDQAMHLSDRAMYAGKRLAPKAGSPLTALVSTIAGIGEKGEWAEIIGLSGTTNSTIGSHTEVQDDVAQGVSRRISGIVNVARNEINPRIRETLNAIEEYKTRQAESMIGTIPTIRQLEVEGLLTDEMFLDMVGAYRESAVDYDKKKLNEAMELVGGELTGDECLTMVTTGSKSLDAKIQAFLGDVLIAAARDIGYMYHDNIVEIPLKKLVLIFLVLNGISLGRLEKMDAISNDTFMNTAVLSYKANIGRRLFQVITRLTDAVKNGALLVPVGIDNDVRPETEMLVVGKTYREWIEKKGGSVEAAIGYALLAKAGTGMTVAEESELISNPTKFVEAYVEYQRHIATMRQSEEITNTPRVIGDYLSGVIAKSDLEDAGKVLLQQRLAKAMEVPYYGNTNVVGYVRDVVCGTWTEGDNVKRVLIDIDQILQESGKDDLDYAVFVAISRLIGRWIAEQIEVGAR